MRHCIAIAALLACTAAAQHPEAAHDERFARPETKELRSAGPDETVCRDRIHTVREERGLPPLQHEADDPEEPYLIAAVDHRIGGCSVMVMRHDTRDVRPIPKPDEEAPLLRPAQ